MKSYSNLKKKLWINLSQIVCVDLSEELVLEQQISNELNKDETVNEINNIEDENNKSLDKVGEIYLFQIMLMIQKDGKTLIQS